MCDHSSMSTTSEWLDEVISLDGSARWRLRRDGDGTYITSVDVLNRGASQEGKDQIGLDTDAGQHWIPDHEYGPFKSVEAAQHKALENLPWFFEAIGSDTTGS